MTRRVVTVGAGTTLERARELMCTNRFSALPVVDDRHRLVGIVTTLDLLRADLAGEHPAGRVGAAMTADPMTMTPDADVRLVAHRLRTYGELRAMPIVERGVLVGIVTRGDLLRPVTRGGPLGRLVHRLRHGEQPGHAPSPMPLRTGGTAADIMTPLPEVVWVDERTPAAAAAALLREHRLSDLPVIDDDVRLVGVVSEADLLPDRLQGRRTPLPATAGTAMTVDPVAVRAGVALDELTREVVARRLRLVPVVGDDDRLVGVVGRGDLLRARSAARA